MWSFEHTEATKAPPERLWQRYSDRASWPEWDHGIKSVTLDGPFAVGSTGKVKPKGGLATKYEVLEVTEGGRRGQLPPDRADALLTQDRANPDGRRYHPQGDDQRSACAAVQPGHRQEGRCRDSRGYAPAGIGRHQS